jgi:hypothetical protein
VARRLGWLSLLAALAAPVLAAAAPATLAQLEARAAESDAPAIIQLAQRYEHAEGVPRDYERAVVLYCRADAIGEAAGAYQLGLMRLYGRGVERDDGAASFWLTRAAEHGHQAAAQLARRVGAASEGDAALCPPPLPAAKPARPPVAPEIVLREVKRLAPKYGLDPALVTAVIAVESAFRTDAVSAKNARGLMQLIPATATRFGVADSFDPVQNLRGGMSYLRWLLDLFQGDVTLAVAAYNAGENAVLRHGGVPPYAETEDYVQRIRRYYGPRHHPTRSP